MRPGRAVVPEPPVVRPGRAVVPEPPVTRPDPAGRVESLVTRPESPAGRVEAGRPEPVGAVDPVAGPGAAERSAGRPPQDNGFSSHSGTKRPAASVLLHGQDIRTGRRAEDSREVREAKRLRAATVIFVVLAVLGAPLALYVIREAARDPVFVAMDELEIPAWASQTPRDEAIGSRWCIRECRFRQRTWRSTRSPEETARVYEDALKTSGWRRWTAAGCPPESSGGIETCWRRDEYVMDLWVYQPECQVRMTSPDPHAADPTAAQVETICPDTVVAMKVVNRVAYHVST